MDVHQAIIAGLVDELKPHIQRVGSRRRRGKKLCFAVGNCVGFATTSDGTSVEFSDQPRETRDSRATRVHVSFHHDLVRVSGRAASNFAETTFDYADRRLIERLVSTITLMIQSRCDFAIDWNTLTQPIRKPCRTSTAPTATAPTKSPKAPTARKPNAPTAALNSSSS